MAKVLLTGLQASITLTLLDLAILLVVAIASGGMHPAPTPEQCVVLAGVFIVLLVLINAVFSAVRGRAR